MKSKNETGDANPNKNHSLHGSLTEGRNVDGKRRKKKKSLKQKKQKSFFFSAKTKGNVFTPVQKISNGRKRIELKPGWSAKLTDILWKKTALPCVWAFKRASYRTNDIICNGQCSICKSEIIAITLHNTKTIQFTIKNNNATIPHPPKNKRRLLPTDKTKFKKLLKGISAYAVRCEIADKKMTAGDLEPPNLPSSNALRIIKHREKTKDFKHDNFALNILDLRKKIC